MVSFLLLSCQPSSKKPADAQATLDVPVTKPVTPVEVPPSLPVEKPLYQIDPAAGKVSLWKRTTGYDCAVFLPADYDSNPSKDYPLILSLHGLNGTVLNLNHTAVGGNRTGFIKQVWGTSLARKYPAIVIAPHESPIGSTASNLWTHAKLRQIILDAVKKYKVDEKRIVVTGLSAGSIATQELVKYSKDLLAGAMPGAYSESPISSNPCALGDIPVWVFGNVSDNYFDSSKWMSIKPKIESCSNYIHEFTLTVYQSSCGHGCWDAHWAKPEVQQWLIDQVRR